MGRLYSTVRSMFPDMSQNLRSLVRTLPVGSMLMDIDQRDQVRALAGSGIPILPEWGCFDRIVPAGTAGEFAALSGSTVQWVPGGHSWMLARPQGQVDVLVHLAAGRSFVADVEDRCRDLGAARPALRAIG